MKYFLYALLIPALCSNCSLDQELYGIAEFDGTVQTESDAELVVNGVFSVYQSFNLFKSSAANLVMYSGDDFSNTNASIGSTGSWINRTFTSSNRYVASVWLTFYSNINSANSAREVINSVESLPESYRRQIDGEMTFARAFSYYYLVRLFGGVPIKTKATQYTDNFSSARASVDEVYAQVFEDFKNASDKCLLFSRQAEKQFGRPTKGAAQAMLAQAYLTYANYCDMNNREAEAQEYYREAVNWCDSVINSGEYILLDNYADLYDVNKERDAYREVIYGIPFTRDYTLSGASSKGSEWAYFTQPSSRRSISGDMANNGVGSGGAKIQPWFYVQYISDDYGNPNDHDYRTDVSFLTRWDGHTSAGVARLYITFPVIVTTGTVTRESMPYINKYADPKGLDNRNHENDLFIIRFSEIYLIKAEALNEMGQASPALAAFNEVRARARKAGGTARVWPRDLQDGLSKEDFRMAVFNERGLELVGEGQRFFDCVRTRYKSTKASMLQWRLQTYYPNLSEYQRKLPQWVSANRAWNSGRAQMGNAVEWHERFLLYPIPTTELDANPAFGKQNPGW
jgi:hypothetical protein